MLLLAAYSNVVFGGQSLVSTANTHPFDYRFTGLDPGDVKTYPATNWYDLGGAWWMWEPAGQFFSRMFRAGDLPLWDPTVGGGADAHVNVVHGQYFPPYTLVLLLGNTPLLRDLYFLALLFGSGGCCVLLLARNGLHPASAVAMGAAYAFGGSMTMNLNAITGQAYAVVPLVVLAGDWFLDRATWRRAAGLAAVVAFCVLASFLPIVLSGLVLLPLLFLARHGLRPPARALVADGVRFAAAVVLGLALAAFLLVPLNAVAAGDPAFDAWYRRLSFQAYSAHALGTMVSPIVTHDVVQVTPGEVPMLPRESGFAAFFYVGLTPLLLGVLARGGGRPETRRLFVFFAAATVFVFLKVLGLRPAQWIAYLPVFRRIHFIPYFCGALNLGLAGLAALGVEHAVRDRPSAVRGLTVVLAAVTVFALIFRFASLHPFDPRADWWMPMRELARLAALSLGVILVVWLRGRGRVAGGAAGVMLAALVVLELAPLARHDRYRRRDVWKDVPGYVAYLQSDRMPFRIHGVHALSLTANTPQGAGLNAISARLAFNPERYPRLVRRFFPSANLPYPLVTGLLPEPRVILDLLNVKYLVAFSGEADAFAAAGLRPMMTDGAYTVFRNDSHWPRAYLARRAHVALHPAAALEAVATLRGPDEVVLEQPPRVPLGGDGEGDVRIRRYDPDRVELRARSDAPAVLVLLDSAAPGWTATVNGAPAPVLHANYAFRGVEVPAGRSDVVFTYRTPGLRLGLGLSALAAAVAALLAAWPGRGRAPRAA